MSRPSPQTSRDETPLRVFRSPCNSCPNPIILVQNTRLLVSLEGELLVVGREFTKEIDDCECSENVVRSAEFSRLLESGDTCRDTEKEENDVLDDGYPDGEQSALIDNTELTHQ